MDSQLFYLLNLLFAALFLAWFLLGRRSAGRAPTQLDLRAEGGTEKPAPTPSSPTPPPPPPRSNPFTDNFRPGPKPKAETGTETPNAKPQTDLRDVTHTSQIAENAINEKKNAKAVRFMYNGHDFEAYEVLGLSRYSTLPEVTKRYQEMIKTGDSSQHEFLEAAFKAILKII